MKSGNRYGHAAMAVALGVAVCGTALAQSVTTRMVVGGGSATSAKIVPGGAVSMDVRLDTVSAALIGTGFRISQTSPGTSGFISITGRSFVGSPFGDTGSGTVDDIVLFPPSNLLDPSNNDNVGRTTINLVGISPATQSNVLAVNLTLTASASTPLGTYQIQPTSGVSFATDDAFNDYDMSTAAPFSIIVGQTLTVTKGGTGIGQVIANSGAINCGSTCSDIYPGTVVTLTAVAASGSTFVGWTGGGCSGTGTCVVTVDAAKSVNATFNLLTFTFSVSKSGTGSGTVTSSPAGIDCGATCSFDFVSGTPVRLTPAPVPGSVFVGWSGACAGTGDCIVTMDAPVFVIAAFNVAPPALGSAVSRRVHGAAGTFNLPLSLVPTNPATEPRLGPAFTIVFTFDKAVTAGNATVTEGAATAGVPTFSGSEMVVPLSSVSNQQYVTVTVSNVTAADGGAGGSGSVRVGILLGDVSQNRVVTVSDLGQVNAQIAQFVTGANYLFDVNVSGTLSVADKGVTNTQITKALPPP